MTVEIRNSKLWKLLVMKPLLFALCVLVAVSCERARADPWQPSAGHTQVPIWPMAIHDTHPVAGSEAATARRHSRGGWLINVS
jgi:hypothetical protein